MRYDQDYPVHQSRLLKLRMYYGRAIITAKFLMAIGLYAAELLERLYYN